MFIHRLNIKLTTPYKEMYKLGVHMVDHVGPTCAHVNKSLEALMGQPQHRFSAFPITIINFSVIIQIPYSRSISNYR